jgi:hypothetical protein
MLKNKLVIGLAFIVGFSLVLLGLYEFFTGVVAASRMRYFPDTIKHENVIVARILLGMSIILLTLADITENKKDKTKLNAFGCTCFIFMLLYVLIGVFLS